MDYEIITLPEQKIVGISNRTGNDDPQMGSIIGGMWQKFYAEGINEKIQNKVNGYAICLYSQYEGSTYDVCVGCEVSQPGNPELSVRTLPAGKYAKFTAHGDMVTAVQNAWAEIWSMDLDRSYTGDYEEYTTDEMEEADINIYIALK